VRSRQTAKLLEATAHARKYLAGHADAQHAIRAAGLLAFPPHTPFEPYKVSSPLTSRTRSLAPLPSDPVTHSIIPADDLTARAMQTLYGPARYPHLAALFLRTHHELLSLPLRPALRVALAAGLSALKTPSCHSAHNAATGDASAAAEAGGAPAPDATQPVCPICSTELNALARSLPYAHHAASHNVAADAVALPSGRVYGRARLEAFNAKMPPPPPPQGTSGASTTRGGERQARRMLRDPAEPARLCGEEEVRRVFIL